MNDSLHIRNLRPLDLNDMYISFLDSFSDYEIPFRLTKEQFVRKFVEKLRIDFSLSAGAFDDEALVGFVFTAVNYYDEKLTAYNGGTGVRPAYRGQRTTARIYEYLIPLFRERRIRQCVLEVLTRNARAIQTYRSIGFRETQFFRCYRLEKEAMKVSSQATSLEIFTVSLPVWDTYDQFAEQTPSFLDSRLMVNQNLANETVIEAHHDSRCVGYAIYQPSFGRISQIGVHPAFRRKGIGSALMQYIYNGSLQKHLTVINVEKQAVATQRFFENLGFINQIDQYEMTLSLE